LCACVEIVQTTLCACVEIVEKILCACVQIIKRTWLVKFKGEYVNMGVTDEKFNVDISCDNVNGLLEM
jgi:hypothetical protein